MELGNFFKSAPYARPVNPRVVQFTAVSRNEILPGGTANPTKRPVAARITAALAFIGGDGALTARVEARKSLSTKFKDAVTDSEDFYTELTYQLVWRALYEYDDKERTLGSRLFPDVDTMRELVEMPEANRLLQMYNQYVKDEHPEDAAPDAETFREVKGTGARLAR